MKYSIRLDTLYVKVTYTRYVLQKQSCGGK